MVLTAACVDSKWRHKMPSHWTLKRLNIHVEIQSSCALKANHDKPGNRANLFNMETVTSWVRSNVKPASLGPCTRNIWFGDVKCLIERIDLIIDRLVYIMTYYKLQLFNLWEKETIPTRLTNISTIIILPILIIFECELEEFAGCVSDRNCDYISIQKRLEERIQCTVWRYTTVLTYLDFGTANWTRKTTVWAFITVPSYEGCWSHSALCSDVPR